MRMRQQVTRTGDLDRPTALSPQFIQPESPRLDEACGWSIWHPTGGQAPVSKAILVGQAVEAKRLINCLAATTAGKR